MNSVHTSRFTIVGNHLAQHGELSLTAIGLAVHIQSLPDGAKTSIKVLADRFPESEARIAAALRELEEHSYLARTLERLPGGKLVTRTISYNQPGAAPVPAAEPEPQTEPGRPAPVRATPPPPAAEPEPAEPLAPEPAQPAPATEATPAPVPHQPPRARRSPSRRHPTWSATVRPPTSSRACAATSPGCSSASTMSAAWPPPSPPGSNVTSTPTPYATRSPPTCPTG